ncbi:DUF6461 domain-containing protein [Streptosporangium subroseum]|uniref:DUF6461 domain-containing protein n=1 Tax=Streptosporangium subroseum TaxID=106412 RepID=UPI003087FEAE|nr:DUF6461 domain-containing protein [Streptosporangium subroseum]
MILSLGTRGDAGFGIEAYVARGGTVLIEYGWGGIVYCRSDLLSEGTTSAAVFANIKSDDFAYYVDGQLITTFGIHSYGYRSGASPDQLQPDLGDLGSNPVNADGRRTSHGRRTASPSP